MPHAAYASDIINSVSCKTASTKVGRAVTICNDTTYAMWGIKNVGVPFMSDWRSEVSATSFARPNTYQKVGYLGTWKKQAGQLGRGKQWVQQGPQRWFYGKTHWYARSTAKAIKKNPKAALYQGQSNNWKISVGYTAYYGVKIK